jgi:homoserine kinase
VQISSDIPDGRFGSSAAAAVAGLHCTKPYRPRPTEDWLAMATELEGHPDNAAAALLGGITVSCQRDGGAPIARSSRWPEAIRLVVATPDLGLHTAHARRVLPAEVPLADAIFNLQRALLMLHALRSGRYEDLREAMKDRWHQPARSDLVPALTPCLEDPAVLGAPRRGPVDWVVTDGAARDPFEMQAPGIASMIRTLVHISYSIRLIRARSGRAFLIRWRE